MKSKQEKSPHILNSVLTDSRRAKFNTSVGSLMLTKPELKALRERGREAAEYFKSNQKVM